MRKPVQKRMIKEPVRLKLKSHPDCDICNKQAEVFLTLLSALKGPSIKKPRRKNEKRK